jgi:hypothetical protein
MQEDSRMIGRTTDPIIRIVLAFVLIGLVLFSGCITDDASEETGDGVERFYVENDSVVCYWNNDVDAGGMSCLPLNETEYQPSANA